MIELVCRRRGFRQRHVWFAQAPHDRSDTDCLYFHACYDPGGDDFDCRATPTFVVDLDVNEDALWAGLKKTCRRDIRLAQRQGVTVDIGGAEDIVAFRRILRRLIRLKGLSDNSYLLRYMGSAGQLLTARKDGEMLAGIVTINDARHSRLLFSASQRHDTPEMSALTGNATRLLIWQGILQAKARGAAQFDLGGHVAGADKSDPTAGITFLKSGFGGREATGYACSKIYNPVYSALREIRARLKSITGSA